METSNTDAALESRIPVLPSERIFTRFLPFFWSCLTFGAGIWVFMIGAGLADIGEARVTIPGFVIGLVVGFSPPLLSAGMPSFRYGVEVLDGSKATFGIRGAVLPLLGLLYCLFVWESVVTAFIGKGAATVFASVTGSNASRPLATALCLLVVAATWWLVKRGPRELERINGVVGPALLILALAMLALLAHRIGYSGLGRASATTIGEGHRSHLDSFMVAIELGIGTSMGNWSIMGGLLRLVRLRRHVVVPSMIGLSLTGFWLGSSVSALMAVSLKSNDPVKWMLDLGGPVLGSLIAIAVLLGNIAIVGLMSYTASVSIQQVRVLGRVGWPVVIATTLIPPLIAAFYIDETLSSVVAFSNYQGMLIVGIAAVTGTDYFLLRHQRLDVPQLYVQGPQGLYWFWGGINWIAFLSIVASSCTYRWMYNPNTLEGAHGFGYIGASIPAFLVGSVAYFALMRLITSRSTIGGYGAEVRTGRVTVSL